LRCGCICRHAIIVIGSRFSAHLRVRHG
jgi:hypothetical protein